MLSELRYGWKPNSRPAALAWLVFYSLFLLHAATSKTGFLMVDHVNLIVHEAGHLLFGWLGPTMGLWGGTLLQLLVPLALLAHFTHQREPQAVVFCLFFFFENFLHISVYMADARAQALPLITVGDPDMGGHDWFNIFSALGLLRHDTSIAAAIRFVGWLGMLASFALVWWFHRQAQVR